MSDERQTRQQSIAARRSKVRQLDLAPPAAPLHGFLERLPHQLAADSLRALTQAIAEAHRRGRPVIVLMGAHVIKVGLTPVLIDLLRRGIVTAVGSNGATLVHDSELALFGHTSEDVESALAEGTFGMTRETHEFVNGAINAGAAEGLGLGAAVGKALAEADAPYAEHSLLAQSWRLGRPLTAHVAIGTDILHMHPTADGAAIGAGSLRDFHCLTNRLGDLGDGGVLLNVGSAVIMPEVALKAFALLRARGVDLSGFTSADLDMIRHYRPTQQIVRRVQALGGQGYAITGHHEIMIPLLAGCVLAEIAADPAG